MPSNKTSDKPSDKTNSKVADEHLAILASGLGKRFADFNAVDGLNLAIPKGSIFGFLGPNGCGKTTTIRMLCGLLSPSCGQVNVLGMSLPKEAEALRMRIGYMTQKFSLYDELSVEENLTFVGDIYGLGKKSLAARISELLEQFSLGDLASRRAGNMSGGQKQRLALAAATVHKPEVLFLDEPTASVDPENRRAFWEKLFEIADSGTTILVATHYMDEAERCHRLAVLEAGQLRIEGSPARLVEQLEGRVLEVRAERLADLKQQLRKLSSVKSVSQAGAALRVLLEPGQADSVLASLHAHGDIDAQLARPSLEDVFVSVTKGERQ
ncbi:ATP-binding cassette domain-containing protein [Agaribacterium sp. ZY112]|uniref:ABC transporter ATP-binding protein n=1 Tax=Agaribacterium sp. ZY112 TaxID=3233574 RepID=UPI003524F5CC